MSAIPIVQKLWNYCNVLRDDGMSYGDYVEQLTYLLFLKMADERTKAPYNQPTRFPTSTVGRVCSRKTAMNCSTTTGTA
jgi:type I restriction enzyme M protein